MFKTLVRFCSKVSSTEQLPSFPPDVIDKKLLVYYNNYVYHPSVVEVPNIGDKQLMSRTNTMSMVKFVNCMIVATMIGLTIATRDKNEK